MGSLRAYVLSATLAYYRAMLDPNKGDPRLNELRVRMQRPNPGAHAGAVRQ